MAARISSLLLLGASAVMAGPIVPRQSGTTVTVTATPVAPTSTAWDAGLVSEYPIHASCNATQHGYIKKGLEETVLISAHARDHILRWGNKSEIYRKYFGDAPTGEPIGWFTKVVDGDKSDILFRCDNPDGNCAQEGWAGHWRGTNATGETVICDLSYETRKPLDAMCMFGYDIANGKAAGFWSADLLHRLFHMPKVGEDIVGHYSSEAKFAGVTELAKENATVSVRNSDSLQYFALEVYAHDIAVPGIGCPGTYTAVKESSAAHAAPTSAASSAASSAKATTTEASATPTAAPTKASSTPTEAVPAPAKSCTPHDDHW